MSCLNPTLRDTCVRGHAWTPENTRLYIVNGVVRQKHCRACEKVRARRQTEQIRGFMPVRGLDAKQLRRLLDAHDDGVSKADLMDRFSLSAEELVQRLADARELEGKERTV